MSTESKVKLIISGPENEKYNSIIYKLAAKGFKSSETVETKIIRLNGKYQIKTEIDGIFPGGQEQLDTEYENIKHEFENIKHETGPSTMRIVYNAGEITEEDFKANLECNNFTVTKIDEINQKVTCECTYPEGVEAARAKFIYIIRNSGWVDKHTNQETSFELTTI